MRPCISIRGSARPSVGPSVRPSVGNQLFSNSEDEVKKRSKGRIYQLTKLVFTFLEAVFAKKLENNSCILLKIGLKKTRELLKIPWALKNPLGLMGS